MRLLSTVKKALIQAYNMILPQETISESKQKWNELAAENARYFVLSNHGKEVSEEQFREDGKKDYETLVTSDSLLHDILKSFGDRKALEIGCGIGRMTEFFASDFSEVVGVDISENMIAQGKKRLAHIPNLELLATDGQTLPGKSDYFDFVFSYIVFQHMPDVATIKNNLKEIVRVLKPQGVGKIQLRGMPLTVSKKEWYYGVWFDQKQVHELFNDLPVKIVRENGMGERYYWLTFIKEG